MDYPSERATSRASDSSGHTDLCENKCYAKRVMFPAKQSTVRIVAQPKTLVDDLARTAATRQPEPAYMSGSPTVLQSEELLAFDQAMAQMASDPNIQQELADIQKEFRGTESDGLPSDTW